MAAPTVAGTPALTNDQTAGTSTPLTMPASITAGETLVAWCAHKAPITEAAISGWTLLIEADQPTGSNATLSVFYKKAAGGDTATMTTTTSTRVAAVVERISGAADPTVTAPEGAAATGQANSINPNPPSLAPAAGSKDYLFQCGFASSHGRITDTGAANGGVPTNYGSGQTSGPNNGTATNIGVGVANRALTTGSAEDPGTFTTTGTGVEEVTSATILIHPAAAGGTNWTATPSDTLGLTDARVFSQMHLYADVLGLTDARIIGRGTTLADGFGLTDSVSAVTVNNEQKADTLGLTDSISTTGVFARTQGDTLGLTDSATPTQGFSRSVDDGLGLTDSATPVSGTGASVSDTLGLTDSAQTVQGFNLSVADGLGLTDNITPEKSGGATDWTQDVDDGFGLTDDGSVTWNANHPNNDTLSLSDSTTTTGVYNRAVSDTFGLSDQATPSSTGANNVSVPDGFGLTDSATPQVAYQRSSADTLGLTDAVRKTEGHVQADTLSLTDVLTRQAVLVRSASDTLGLTDSVATESADTTIPTPGDVVIVDSASSGIVLGTTSGDGIAVSEGQNGAASVENSGDVVLVVADT